MAELLYNLKSKTFTQINILNGLGGQGGFFFKSTGVYKLQYDETVPSWFYFNAHTPMQTKIRFLYINGNIGSSTYVTIDSVVYAVTAGTVARVAVQRQHGKKNNHLIKVSGTDFSVSNINSIYFVAPTTRSVSTR